MTVSLVAAQPFVRLFSRMLLRRRFIDSPHVRLEPANVFDLTISAPRSMST